MREARASTVAIKGVQQKIGAIFRVNDAGRRRRRRRRRRQRRFRTTSSVTFRIK